MKGMSRKYVEMIGNLCLDYKRDPFFVENEKKPFQRKTIDISFFKKRIKGLFIGHKSIQGESAQSIEWNTLVNAIGEKRNSIKWCFWK